MTKTRRDPDPVAQMEVMRLDKWLWVARLFKTRSLANKALKTGRIRQNGKTPKPSANVRPGDEILLNTGTVKKTIVIHALSAHRGPAPVATTLYQETPESVRLAEMHKLESRAHRMQHHFAGRPTKKNRRSIVRFTGRDQPS